MTQTKLQSFIEAITNTAIGFMVTMMVYPFINWICGIEMTIGQAGLSTILFTIVSIVRGYVIRRFFNNLSGVKQSFDRNYHIIFNRKNCLRLTIIGHAYQFGDIVTITACVPTHMIYLGKDWYLKP